MYKRQIVMRLIEPNGADPSRPMEAQFTKYTRLGGGWVEAVSYTHLRAHETVLDLVCRLLLVKITITFWMYSY